MVSIVDHPGMEASYIDSAVGISDIFPLLAPAIRDVQNAGAQVPETETAAGLGWAFSINLPSSLPAEDTLSVWGLPNVLRILDDIDKGRLQQYTFIECHACFEGCVSGALTVENPYVARARALRLQQSLPKRDLVDAADMRARHDARRLPDDGAVRRAAPAPARPGHRRRHHPDAGARPDRRGAARHRLRRLRVADLRDLRRGRRHRRGRGGAVRRSSASGSSWTAGAAVEPARRPDRGPPGDLGGAAMTVAEMAARLDGTVVAAPPDGAPTCAAGTCPTCCPT